MNRWIAGALAVLASAIGLAVGGLCTYLLFPLARVGKVFPEFASQLPGHGDPYLRAFLVWVLLAAIGAVLGLVVLFASPKSQPGRFSRRRIAEACLLSFGYTLGFSWLFEIMVGQGMYSYMPDAPLGLSGLALWIPSICGWLAVVIFFLLMLRDHYRKIASRN